MRFFAKLRNDSKIGQKFASTYEAASSIVSATAYATIGVALAHPLNNLNIEGITYDGHQPTALDFSAPAGTPIYATMAGGDNCCGDEL